MTRREDIRSYIKGIGTTDKSGLSIFELTITWYENICLTINELVLFLNSSDKKCLQNNTKY